MTYKFTIPGRLPGMNEYTAAQRKNRFEGAKMKGKEQAYICACITSQIRKVSIYNPVIIHYAFYEKNKKRDLDNIAGFAHKVVQDAMVECRTIQNDGWNEVVGFTDRFAVDKKNPRIEVTLEEV